METPLLNEYYKERDLATRENEEYQEYEAKKEREETKQYTEIKRKTDNLAHAGHTYMFYRYTPNFVYNNTTKKMDDTRQYLLTSAERFYGALGDILAGFLGFALALYLIIYMHESGLFRPQCPTVNGAVCNFPYGTCTDFGFCECVVPTFSGKGCEVSGCLGYSDIDRTVCGGRGMCSPGMKFENILEVCRWDHPSRENGFLPIYTNGWDHPDCVAELELRRQEINAATSVEDIEAIENILGVPQCVCDMPFFGPECAADSNACPIAVDNSVCSGNGNTSVTYPNNFTTSGLGCQCTEIFNLLDPIYYSQFSESFQFEIQTRYFR